jgi:hypothetical protein
VKSSIRNEKKKFIKSVKNKIKQYMINYSDISIDDGTLEQVPRKNSKAERDLQEERTIRL